jgi:hypothetical protein
MAKMSLEVSPEEAAALLTCLEYYILYDLERKNKLSKRQLPGYEPIPDSILRTLNVIRPKLLTIVKGST